MPTSLPGPHPHPHSLWSEGGSRRGLEGLQGQEGKREGLELESVRLGRCKLGRKG